MIKIEAFTLEDAYKDAASTLSCSVTELKIEVIQYPTKGLLGLFKKKAVIVATKQMGETVSPTKEISQVQEQKQSIAIQQEGEEEPAEVVKEIEEEINIDIEKVAKSVRKDINDLFNFSCFDIEEVEVSAYDNSTLLVEFKGEDAALLIGKEGYRYKALSYMIFNWINARYQVQLRLEIAEFLKNQEEAISRYLVSVAENIDRDGRAQTKILDGVLVQIALKELREMYPDKYVVIRSTRDGLKYIIINDYHSN